MRRAIWIIVSNTLRSMPGKPAILLWFLLPQIESLVFAFFIFFLYPGHHNNHSKNDRTYDYIVLDLFEEHGDDYS
jgi:hypothetical protein